jgi:hypothetical protein
MKNKRAYLLSAALLLLATLVLPDGLFYAIILAVGILVYAGLNAHFKIVFKYLRWSKANPVKTQWLMGVMQTLLAFLGLILGYNLYKLDVGLSNTTAISLTVLMVVGLLSVNILPTRQLLVIPQRFVQHRLGFLALGLAFFGLNVFTGNRISEKHPDFVLSRMLEKMDAVLFAEPAGALSYSTGNAFPQALAMNKSAGIERLMSEKVFTGKLGTKLSAIAAGMTKKTAEIDQKKQYPQNSKIIRQRRENAAVGICVLSVFLIILLIFPACAGTCYFIAGVSEGMAGYIIGGFLLAAASVMGMYFLGRLCHRSAHKERESQQKQQETPKQE